MDKYNEYDKYCYKDTRILINKLNIKNENKLEEVEEIITSKTIDNIVYKEPPYSLTNLEEIHKTLFSELYEWAGKIRLVSISKQDTLFCPPCNIESNIDPIFSNLKSDNWLCDLDEEIFYDKMAYYYCEFNMIHPFREGNGRVQRIFFQHLALYNGYSFDWSLVDKNIWLEVNIQGVLDHSNMRDVFKKILKCKKY